MASELPRDTHGLQVPDNNSAIDSSGGKVVTLAVEPQHGRTARPDGAGQAFRIILKQVVVR